MTEVVRGVFEVLKDIILEIMEKLQRLRIFFLWCFGLSSEEGSRVESMDWLSMGLDSVVGTSSRRTSGSAGGG